MNLSFRSGQKELIDDTGISFPDIRQNMIELEKINSMLGGHSITLSGFKKLHQLQPVNKKLLVCEIGCGGGDNLKVIEHYCKKKQIPVSFIGIDINPETIRYAESNCKNIRNIFFFKTDYKKAVFQQQPDIIFSSLFCHHFSNDELTDMMLWKNDNSTLGFFINDLQRHWLAFKSIKFLTGAFSKSYLVKNDAPVSVSRGFTKPELQNLFKQAGINNFSIEWKWAFRWLMIVKKNQAT